MDWFICTRAKARALWEFRKLGKLSPPITFHVVLEALCTSASDGPESGSAKASWYSALFLWYFWPGWNKKDSKSHKRTPPWRIKAQCC